MNAMKFVVSALLASMLVVPAYASNCQINAKDIACTPSKNVTALQDELKSIHLSKLASVTFHGPYVGKYLNNINEETKQFWHSRNVKSLKLVTYESQTDFSHQAFCVFSKSLTKLDYSTTYATRYGNFTEMLRISCLSHLKELDCNRNDIEAITSNSLQGLKSLEVLLANDNNVSRIDADAFSRHTPNIQKINLQNNGLKYIPESTFRNLSDLKHLDLSNNQLKNIDGMFTYLPNLKDLALDDNRISVLKSGTFSNGLPKLEILSLTYNWITKMESRALNNLPSLEIFDLENNMLGSILADAMVGLPKLDTVRFGYNNIANIENRAFFGMPNVTSIELYLNDLTVINQASFGPMWSSLEVLDVGANRITCDCKVKWLAELLQNKTTASKQPEVTLQCLVKNSKTWFDISKVPMRLLKC